MGDFVELQGFAADLIHAADTIHFNGLDLQAQVAHGVDEVTTQEKLPTVFPADPFSEPFLASYKLQNEQVKTWAKNVGATVSEMGTAGAAAIWSILQADAENAIDLFGPVKPI